MTKITCPVYRAAKEIPDQPAIITKGAMVTYRELDVLIQKTMKKLAKNGVMPGDRVAVTPSNSLKCVVFLLALWRKKAAAILSNPNFPKVDCNRIHQDLHLKKNFDHDATILLTSGSTGKPKRVVHTFANHYYSALGSNKNFPVKPGDRWLLSLPLYHVSGLGILFRTFLGGGTVVCVDEKMTPALLKRYKITHLSMVTTQLYRFLKEDLPKKKLPTLKGILLGGSVIPESLIKKARLSKLPILTTYGLTEMSSQVVTAGKILPFRRLKIANDGEILAKGKTLFRGYIVGKKVVRPLNKEGWFKTGDLGRWDKKNGFIVLGRKDRMFISGGENIYPEEIEKALAGFPSIETTCVISIPSEEFGARPIGILKLKKKNALNAQMLNVFLRGRLARFKIPDKYFYWPAGLPMSLKYSPLRMKNHFKSNSKKFIEL